MSQNRIQFAPIFQSHMVLQREKNVPVWGTASAGSEITLEFQNHCVKTEADAKGQWQLNLPPLHASVEETMVISDGCSRIQLSDIAVGEVWIAGGQSNMEFHMRYEKHLQDVLPDCRNSNIRFFDVPEVAFPGQSQCFDYSRMGIWRQADPENLEYFSAVGYYFARDLQESCQVPVGIIGCNWGGTTASAWMRKDTVEKVGSAWMDDFRKAFAEMDMTAYWEKQRQNPLNDRGNPFADPFGELVMPRTVSQAELGQLFAVIGPTIGAYMSEPMPPAIPGGLYENMLQPLAPFAARGVLWYQGESDDPHAEIYEQMLAGLVDDWRDLWNEQLPFYVVQLPGFSHWLDNQNMHYDILRKAQEAVSQTVPQVFLCSISDAGEELDIHPKNKKIVGQRLSMLARQHTYGQHLQADAPTFADGSLEGKTVTLDFHAPDGLYIDGEALAACSITSEGVQIPYCASVKGSSVVLNLAQDAKCVTVSFACTPWYRVNLYSNAGVPAVPFCIQLTQK